LNKSSIIVNITLIIELFDDIKVQRKNIWKIFNF